MATMPFSLRQLIFFFIYLLFYFTISFSFMAMQLQIKGDLKFQTFYTPELLFEVQYRLMKYVQEDLL